MAFEELGLSRVDQLQIRQGGFSEVVGRTALSDIPDLYAQLETIFDDAVAIATEHTDLDTDRATLMIALKLMEKK